MLISLCKKKKRKKRERMVPHLTVRVVFAISFIRGLNITCGSGAKVYCGTFLEERSNDGTSDAFGAACEEKTKHELGQLGLFPCQGRLLGRAPVTSTTFFSRPIYILLCMPEGFRSCEQ